MKKYTERRLQQMFDRNPRDLDELAHKVIFPHIDLSKITPVGIRAGAWSPCPAYSTDLNAANMLEQELAKRNLLGQYGQQWAELIGNVVAFYSDGDDRIDHQINYGHFAKLMGVDARQRTIKAILAMQSASS